MKFDLAPTTGLPSRQLALLNDARIAIREAKSVDDLRDIRDKAAAIKAYAKARGDCFEIQQNASEIKLRAERRAGEMLATMKRGQVDDPPTMTCPDCHGRRLITLLTSVGPCPTCEGTGVAPSPGVTTPDSIPGPYDDANRSLAAFAELRRKLASAPLFS